MILFIWHSIHKPHVEIDIRVNISFIVRGIFIVRRLFKEVVISNVLIMSVFKYKLFIKYVGNVLKKIIVPRMAIKVFIFLVILFIRVSIIFSLVLLNDIFLGFIICINRIFDKMLEDMIIKAILWVKMAFKKVYVNMGEVYLVTASNLVVSSLYLLRIYALDGEPDIILIMYI